MKGITLRFGDDIHTLIKTEAAHQGIGVSAYIREAALARAIISRAQRGHYTQAETFNRAVRAFLTAEEAANR